MGLSVGQLRAATAKLIDPQHSESLNKQTEVSHVLRGQPIKVDARSPALLARAPVYPTRTCRLQCRASKQPKGPSPRLRIRRSASAMSMGSTEAHHAVTHTLQL